MIQLCISEGMRAQPAHSSMSNQTKQRKMLVRDNYSNLIAMVNSVFILTSNEKNVCMHIVWGVRSIEGQGYEKSRPSFTLGYLAFGEFCSVLVLYGCPVVRLEKSLSLPCATHVSYSSRSLMFPISRHFRVSR